MHKLIFSAVLATSAIAMPAAAQHWVIVSQSDVTMVGVDKDSVTSNLGKQLVWTVTIPSARDVLRMEPQNKTYDYYLSRFEIDCRLRTSRERTVSYFSIGTSGPVFTESDVIPTRDVVPGTIHAGVFDSVCVGMPDAVGATDLHSLVLAARVLMNAPAD